MLFRSFPPEPPHIHEFIYPLSDKEIMAIVDKKHFLMSVFSMQQQLINIDELLLACIRFVHKQKKMPSSYYISLLETYAVLVGNEYRRIKLFASRLEEISNSIFT